MDNEVTEHMRALFLGVAPERTAELEQLWKQYNPVAHVVSDDHEGNLPVMEAGLYRFVRFNHRILRMIWLLSFSAWDGYVAIHQQSRNEDFSAAFERFKSALEIVGRIGSATDPDSIAFPDGIPEPGTLAEHQPGSYAIAVREVAIFAAGWAFLHEVRHLIHQQDGTGGGEAPAERHREELSCDEYATRFLLEKVGEYAKANQAPESKVAFKRQLGIYFAIYALVVIGRSNWGASPSHPAIQRRVDQVLTIMEENGFSKGAAVFAATSFAALLHVLPNAPSPLAAINRRAITEKWDAESLSDIGLTDPDF